MMEQLVLFSPAYRLFLGEGHIILQSGEHHIVLEGEPACWLGKVIGAKGAPVDSLYELVRESSCEDEIISLIDDLRLDSILVECPSTYPRERLSQWGRLAMPFNTIREKLKCSGIDLHTHGLDPAPYTEALSELGISSTVTLKKQVLPVVLVNDIMEPGLIDYQKRFQQAHIPWLVAVQEREFLSWMYVYPRAASCLQCLQSRLSRRPFRAWIRDYTREVVGHVPERHIALQAKILASELLQYLIHEPEPDLEAAWHRMDLVRLVRSRHPIQRNAECTCCRPKLSVLATERGSGARASASDIVDSLSDPVTGIVTSLKPLISDDKFDIHVWVASHPLSRRIATLESLKQHSQFHSTGRGSCPEEARTLAVFEAAERLSGVWRPELNTIRGSFEELREAAIDPDVLQLFHERQYRVRTGWNASHHPVLHVPEAFDKTKNMSWVAAEDLLGGERRYVPAAYAYYDVDDEGSRYCVANSNGCAAGSTRNQAILNGVYEIVERDAVSLWWYNRSRRPGIDLTSQDDENVQRVLALHRSLHRECWVLDLTTDLGIPVFVAISRTRDEDQPHWLIGFGCDMDVNRALRKSLSEMNQMLPLLLNHLPIPPLWTTSSDAEEQHISYIYPSEMNFLPSCVNSKATDATLETLSKKLKKQDFSAYVVDQTDVEIGVDVVRVIIPGMYHFWRRLGGQRLYEAPVKLGWRRDPISYRELNPLSIVL